MATQARRNMVGILTEGIFFFTGIAFLDTNVIVPVFLEGVTGNRDLVGVAATVRQMGFLLPTLLMAGLIHRIGDIRRFLLSLYWLRMAPLALVALALLIPGVPPLAIAVTFLGAMALFMLGDGASQLSWIEVLHGAVPADRRGQLIGWIQALGGAGALLAGLLVTRMLERPILPLRGTFAVFMLVAAAALSLSALGFHLVRVGRIQAGRDDSGSPLLWFRRIPGIISGNSRFRRMLLLQFLIGTGSMALPFYALYLKDTGAVPLAWIGILNVTQVLGSIVGGLILGWCNDRFGPAATLRFSSIVAMIIPALGLAAGFLGVSGVAVALLLFVLVGISGGAWLGQTNYVMNVAPQQERPYYIATTNLNSVVISLLPMVGGLVSRVAPYTTVFVIVLACQVVGLLVALSLPVAVASQQS